MCWIAFLEMRTCENNVGTYSWKESRRKRNALFPLVQDFCQLCSCSFKVQYESQARQTGSENLFQPSKQKGSIGVVLAKRCENIGLTLKQCEGKSDRVCSACGREIRTLHQLYSFVACTVIAKRRVYVRKDQTVLSSYIGVFAWAKSRDMLHKHFNERWHCPRLRSATERNDWNTTWIWYFVYHRFRWYVTLENKTPVETFPKFPSVLLVDRSDRNPPITATSVTF